MKRSQTNIFITSLLVMVVIVSMVILYSVLVNITIFKTNEFNSGFNLFLNQLRGVDQDIEFIDEGEFYSLSGENENVVVNTEIGGRVQFNEGGESHSVTLFTVDENKRTAQIIVASNPQIYEINEGEENEYDVDNDGEEDVTVKLNSIVDDNNVVVTVTLLNIFGSDCDSGQFLNPETNDCEDMCNDCDSCGTGIFNLCSSAECVGIGDACSFSGGLLNQCDYNHDDCGDDEIEEEVEEPVGDIEGGEGEDEVEGGEETLPIDNPLGSEDEVIVEGEGGDDEIEGEGNEDVVGELEEPETIPCEDSDSVIGVTEGTTTYGAQTEIDECLDDNNVIEYFCVSDTEIGSITIPCNFGCVGGACSEAPEQPLPSGDTACDNGIDDDGDSYTDMADPGCSDESDDDESDDCESTCWSCSSQSTCEDAGCTWDIINNIPPCG